MNHKNLNLEKITNTYLLKYEENYKKRNKMQMMNILRNSFRDGVRLFFEKCSTSQDGVVQPYQIEETEGTQMTDLDDANKSLGQAAMYVKPPKDTVYE